MVHRRRSLRPLDGGFLLPDGTRRWSPWRKRRPSSVTRPGAIRERAVSSCSASSRDWGARRSSAAIGMASPERRRARPTGLPPRHDRQVIRRPRRRPLPCTRPTISRPRPSVTAPSRRRTNAPSDRGVGAATSRRGKGHRSGTACADLPVAFPADAAHPHADRASATVGMAIRLQSRLLINSIVKARRRRELTLLCRHTLSLLLEKL